MNTPTQNQQAAEAPELDPTNTIHREVLDKLAALQAALELHDPNIKDHLKAIHVNLISNEELAYLLKPEQIATIIKGQMRMTNTTLLDKVSGAGKSASGKAAAVKKSANLGLGDI